MGEGKALVKEFLDPLGIIFGYWLFVVGCLFFVLMTNN